MTDFLSLLPSVAERDLQLQQALADSARDLSVDERYVLRRLASIVAQELPSAKAKDVFVRLPVSEFAQHVGLTQKVAFRRLDVATHSLFERDVRLWPADGSEVVFRWVGMRGEGEDYFDLSFTGFFVEHLISALQPVRVDEVVGSVDFAGEVAGPAVLCLGAKQPYGLPVVLTSRLKARTKRPKGMSMLRLLERVGKRFKVMLDEDELQDVFDMVLLESPWRGKDDSRYYKYTYRDMKKVHQWIVENMEIPAAPSDRLRC